MGIKAHNIKTTLFIIIFLSVFSLNSIAQNNQKPWEQPPRHLSLQGKIEFPVDGSKVPRHISVTGTITGNYRNLWLVERVGQLHWPKEPELKPTAGKWKGEVFEGGWPSEGRFELLLMDVSTETSSAFCRWLSNGHQTGHYPGLNSEDLGAAVVLDKKQYELIAK